MKIYHSGFNSPLTARFLVGIFDRTINPIRLIGYIAITNDGKRIGLKINGTPYLMEKRFTPTLNDRSETFLRVEPARNWSATGTNNEQEKEKV